MATEPGTLPDASNASGESSEPQIASPTIADPGAGVEEASILTWLPRLLFRPRRFFTIDLKRLNTVAVVFFVLLIGSVWGLDRNLGTRGRMHARQGEKVSDKPSTDYILGYAIGQGIILGPIWYFLGGAWYGLRVRLCRTQKMDWKLARRMYLLTELVWAVPMALGFMSVWMKLGPAVFLAGWGLAVVMMFWSLGLSYLGVQAVFAVEKKRSSIVYFIVLPCLVYGIVIGAGLWVNRYSPGVQGTPVRFENAQLSFERPRSWKQASPDQGEVAQFKCPYGSIFTIALYLPEQRTELSETIESVVAFLNKDSTTPVETSEFGSWGSFTGKGLCLLITTEGTKCFFRVFSTVLPDGRSLLIREGYPVVAEEAMQLHFEVVRKSLKVKPPPLTSMPSPSSEANDVR